MKNSPAAPPDEGGDAQQRAAERRYTAIVRSVIEALGSKAFPRVRIGIGRPASKSANVDYLLDVMTKEEAELLDGSITRGAEAVETILAEGVLAAMNRFNGRNKDDDG